MREGEGERGGEGDFVKFGGVEVEEDEVSGANSKCDAESDLRGVLVEHGAEEVTYLEQTQKTCKLE